VAAADAARRRLERDLHDGAQQRVLALAYDVRLARSAAERDGDAELSLLLGAADEETQAALADLRDLAHGIFPAILAEAGLAAALETLAEGAPLAVAVDDATGARAGASAEIVAYATVAEAIDDATGRGATFADVELRREGDRLVVAVRDDGAQRIEPLVRVGDRVGALGGVAAVDANALRAEIPCE
jgi:signal transduction histidine kinase